MKYPTWTFYACVLTNLDPHCISSTQQQQKIETSLLSGILHTSDFIPEFLGSVVFQLSFPICPQSIKTFLSKNQ